MTQSENSLRLGKRYSRTEERKPDVKELLDAQSFRAALIGAVVALLLLNAVWVYGSVLLDRFFPWFSVVQGFFIGRAVQRYGCGIDWRFPLLAAGVAIVAAFSGSFLSALFLTSLEFGASVWSLLGDTDWHTVSTFALREFGVVGSVYAGMAAVIAGFFAGRRLKRQEAIVLRKHREGTSTETRASKP